MEITFRMKSLNFSVVFCSFHDNSSHTGDEEGNKQAGGILFSRDPRPAEIHLEGSQGLQITDIQRL